MSSASLDSPAGSWPPPEVRLARSADGAVRTEISATDQITGRMGRDFYRGQRAVWWILTPALLLFPPLWGAADGLIGEGRIDLSLLLISVVVGMVVFAIIVLGLLYRNGPREYRAMIVAGTPLIVDLTDEWIGMGHTEYRAVSFDQVDEIRRVGQTLLVHGAGTTLTVPIMLLPPNAAAELAQRFRRSHRRSVVAAGTWFPTPEFTPPGGVPPADTVRVTAVADETTADRLDSAVRTSPAVRWFLLLIPLPLLAVAEYALRDTLTWPDLVIGVGMVVSFYAIAAYFLLRSGPRLLRRLAGPGSPLAAQYNAQWITVRLGGSVHAVPARQVRRARLSGDVWLLSRGIGRAWLTIPAELVPSQVSEAWPQRRP